MLREDPKIRVKVQLSSGQGLKEMQGRRVRSSGDQRSFQVCSAFYFPVLALLIAE